MKKFLYTLLFSATLFGTSFAAVPTISSITETSTPLSTSTVDANVYYGNGETIQFTVQFSELVNVVGAPELQFRARNLLEEATYISGSGTDTLIFEYTVLGGLNDWNGVVAEKFVNFTAVDFIESISTSDLLVENFGDISFPVLRIDGNAPLYGALNDMTTDGTVVGPTRYLAQGDQLSFQMVLGGNDTWDSSGYIEYQVGVDTGLQDNFGNSVTGQENTANATTTTTFLNGRNGVVQITNVNFVDKAGKSLASAPAYPISTNIIVDTINPTISFGDNVEGGPVSSDTITISVTDANPDASTHEYGYSADAICDGTDTYGNAFTSGTPFVITSELQNGNYICVRAIDLAGNESFQVSANTLNVDMNAPVFSNIGVVSNNTNTSVAQSGDTLTFTLTLATTDTSNGGTITFDIGASTGLTATIPTSATSTTHTATFTVGAENGAINITGITFTDNAANALTGFAGPVVPTPTVLVDTIDPVITFTDDVVSGPVTSDDISITVTDTNPDIASYEYGYSADAICNGTDTYGNTFTSGVPFTVNTETQNGNYICVRALDTIGNESFQGSVSPLNIDITAPVFSNIGVSSDNLDPSLAKSGDTLTFTLQLGAADTSNGGTITFDIGATTGLTAPIPAGPASLVHTTTFVIGAENGAINITGITLNDVAGNAMTGFTGPTAPTPTVLIDTIAPNLDSVSVSTTGNPGWARHNQYVNYILNFSEGIVLSTLNSATVANNATLLNTEFDAPTFVTSDNIRFRVQNGDNGNITINSADFIISDGAGNTLNINAATINALVPVAGQITADTTRPVISNTTISSNNALDTTLAKTNDTITVNFDTSDNLSPTVSFSGTRHILNQNVTSSNVGPVGGGNFIARFTSGVETSETIVPFQFRVRDEAGNNSLYKNNTDDASQVQFDRTNPMVRNVSIISTSVDGSAFTGDAPTYYAKQGDTITLTFEAKDYVEILNLPNGNILGMVPTVTQGPSMGIEGSGEWFLWTAEITNVDGVEGTVQFDILVNDNAGNGDGVTNGEVHITGTTDGTEVIFDKTLPTIPTTVNDILGAETLNFKQRDNAIFTWSGQTDPNTSGADTVAGIWKYLVRLTNQAGGGEDHRGTATMPEEVFSPLFDGRTSNIPDPGQTKIPARAETDHYQFHLVTVDKAGNYSHGDIGALTWGHGPLYSQPYTIGISGYVVDHLGNPIHSAQVQVAARYGEVCDTGQEVCYGTTDANGFYSIVLKKEQDYNITYFKPNYLLQKFERRIELDDINQDIQMTPVNFENFQTLNQTGTILTTKTFFDGFKDVATQIFVDTLSGQMTVTYVKETAEIFIESLSRITSVTSNDPSVVIIDNGNNTFTVQNAGNIKQTVGTQTTFTQNDLGLGIILSEGNGKPTFSQGTGYNVGGKSGLWTREQVLKDNARIDAGFDSEVLTYTNTNGYTVFAGYQSGRLSIEKLSERRTRRAVPRTAEAIIARGKELKEEKATPYLSSGNLTPVKIERFTAGDEYKGQLARKAHLAKKVNKFARKRKIAPRKSTMRHKYQNNPMIKIAGHSIRMDNLVR